MRFNQTKLAACVFSMLILLGSHSTALAGTWQKAKVKAESGAIHRSASPTAEVLGKYPQGTSLTVTVKPTNGFHAIYYKQLFKGTHYAWIAAEDLDLSQDIASDVSRNPSSEGGNSDTDFDVIKKNAIRVGASGRFITPTDYQAQFGDPATRIFNFAIEAEFQHNFSPSFGAFLIAERYSFSQPIASAGNPAVNYSVTGYAASVGINYSFYNKKKLHLSVRASGGASLNTAGNTNSSSSISTNSVLGYPIRGMLMLDWLLNPHWGLYLKGGYQIHVLSAVPTLYLNSLQSSANLSMSGLLASLGVTYSF